MIPMLRLACTDSEQLAHVYHFANLKVSQTESHVWISGFSDLDQFDQLLSYISPVEQYFQDDSGLVYRRGQLVPVSDKINNQWIAIQDFVNIQIPESRLSGKVSGQRKLSIQRMSEKENSPYWTMPNVLLCDLSTLNEWVASASEFKLKPLTFATSSHAGATLVRGEPLPPISGRYFCESEGIAVPAGYRIEPSVEPDLIAKWLRLSSGDMVLFDVAGEPKRIDAGKFAAVCRSAVRSTVREFDCGRA